MTSGMEAEDAEMRARYYAPEVAFDRPVPKVPPAAFLAERDQAFAPGAATGLIPLDQSDALGCPWPATTPTMLARYLVLNAGERCSHRFASTGEVWYAIVGAGSTNCEGEGLSWRADDAFCLAGDTLVEHHASERSVLLCVTNEPELTYLRAAPSRDAGASIRPALFPRERTEAHLREVHGRNAEQRSAGKSVVFVTELMERRRLTTPTLLAAVNTLEPGGDQRPHRHSSAALTLSLAGEGVYSMVDGHRLDWSQNALIVTPPGAVHSHHNRGGAMMRSFVVQDTALHTELRTTNFAWTD